MRLAFVWPNSKSLNRDPKTISDFSRIIMEVQEVIDPNKQRIIFIHTLSLDDNTKLNN